MINDTISVAKSPQESLLRAFLYHFVSFLSPICRLYLSFPALFLLILLSFGIPAILILFFFFHFSTIPLGGVVLLWGLQPRASILNFADLGCCLR